MTERKIWTLMEILRWTAEYLGKNNLDNPRLEAELLMAHLLGLTRVDLYVQHDRPMEEAELLAYKDLVKRRLRREPIAYIVGYREFWKSRFFVDSRVMVPRPESEMLVEEALAFAGSGTDLLLADACTGSGCVICSILAERPGFRGWATDISVDALAVAKHNAELLGVSKRAEFLQGDGLSPLQALGGKVDVITANPPYVPDGEWADLPADIRVHEPRISVTSGADGLDVAGRLIPQAFFLLKHGGLFVMEFSGPAQVARITSLCAGAGFPDVAILKDAGGIERVLKVKKP